MFVSLRPHHGMCFQFYQGKGYNDTFTDHMGRIIKDLSADPTQSIVLQTSADIVCENCPNRIAEHCVDHEKVSRYDEAVLRTCGRQAGDTISYAAFINEVKEKIINAGLRSSICGDCCWNALCGQ